uniref:RAD51 associated protein 1 n=1 Tax=Myripristis murdjan TaxID=586833 RepID=A0A668AS88_9TELE
YTNNMTATMRHIPKNNLVIINHFRKKYYCMCDMTRNQPPFECAGNIGLNEDIGVFHRKPLEEKLLQRDLEAAITLSLLHEADGKENQSLTSNGMLYIKGGHPVDENTNPSSLHLSNCSVNVTLLGLDKITAEQESGASSRQRKAASKATEQQRSKMKDEDEDEDYQPKLTPDSESDEDYSEQDESEDEEFTVKKANKSTKKEKGAKKEKSRQPPVSKKEKPAKAKSQPKAKLTSEPKRAAAPTTAATFKPAASLSPAGGRIPKWTPPGQIGKSPSSSQSAAVRSPGQGLRLGLSRLVRVKPLHPSVASH